MISNQIRLNLLNKMIAVDEAKLAEAMIPVNKLRAGLDRLYANRNKVEREIAQEERDTAPLVKPQPQGHECEGWPI